jgi:hypothetical protein
VGSLAYATMVRGRSMERGVNSKNNSRSKLKGGGIVKRRITCGKSVSSKKKIRKNLNLIYKNKSISKNSLRNLVDESVSSKDVDMLYVLPCKNLQNEWILDYATSLHMTPCRDWFYTYGSCDGFTWVIIIDVK